MLFSPLTESINRVVILRGCDFFDFSQKPSLKTLRLDAKNSRILNKVTSSERSEESLLRFSPRTKGEILRTARCCSGESPRPPQKYIWAQTAPNGGLGMTKGLCW